MTSLDYPAGVREGPGPLRIHAVTPRTAETGRAPLSLCRRIPLLLIGERFDPDAVYACPDCRQRVDDV
jgi:hypothetical protein